MKPSRCSIGGFSSLKRILRASQAWKLPIDIFVHWKILLHSMRKFCNGFFVKLGDSYTLLDVYNISEKLKLAHAHYEASTMRPPSRPMSQPHFEGNVRLPLTLLKMGLGSPPGLPKI
jgi:hypothetical protein